MDERIQEIVEKHTKQTAVATADDTTDKTADETITDYREKRKDSFIRLDRNLARVLGLNNAVVFCHLMGIEQSINKKRGTATAIYQQYDVLEYETTLSKATLIKIINYLRDLKLLHVIKGTERNKNKYKIDYDNLNELQKIIKKSINKKSKKSHTENLRLQEEVINLYKEYIKNNTTSSDNFITTEKNLNKKELIRKRKSTAVSQQQPKNKTINYYNNKIFDESITYYYIPYIFKEEENEKDKNDFLLRTKNIHKNELNILEYFLSQYHARYGRYHKPIDIIKLRELTQEISNVLDTEYINNDIDLMTEIIDEYFNTKNTTKARDLTLYLFLSKDSYGNYNWIETIYKRLYDPNSLQEE